MVKRKPNRRERRLLWRMQRSPALQALWSSAFALSALPDEARADAPVDRYTAEYNFSLYSEDDLEDDKVATGNETSRYEIEMHQLNMRAPLSDRSDLALEIVHETMSGASPWFAVEDCLACANPKPVQFMSGATIDDERTDLLVQWNRYSDNSRVGWSGGYSTENDYSAINLGVDLDTHFNEGNTTLSAGLGLSFDSIDPTDAGDPAFPNRPSDEDKQTYTLLFGLSQILNRATVVQSSLTYRHSHGYLSDPYKEVYVVGAARLPDDRPDTRNQLAWLTRFRGHVRELDGTLQADYRLGVDDWDILSHTMELAWQQNFGDRLIVVPSFRYYSQSEADFYVPFYDATGTLPGYGAPPADGPYSSDYRLTSYGALTFGLKGQYLFRTPWTGRRDFVFTVAWDRYFASEDLSFDDNSQEAPGHVSYTVFTVGLSVRW